MRNGVNGRAEPLFSAQPVTVRLEDGSHESYCVELRQVSREALVCSGALPYVAPGTSATVTLRFRDRFLVPRRLEIPVAVRRVLREGGSWELEPRIEDDKSKARFEAYLSRAREAFRRLDGVMGAASPMAEAFRTVQVGLGPLERGRPRVVLVTSAAAGEGKSFVSSGLALVLAQEGYRALLVDADLYGPTQHEIFDLSPEPGVAELLKERDSTRLLEFIQETSSGVFLLPAGAEGVPRDFYSRPAVQALCDRLRAAPFDVVVVDSPPLLGTASGFLLAQAADQVLLTVRAGKSLERDLERTRTLLERHSVGLHGVVLNDSGESDLGKISSPSPSLEAPARDRNPRP